MLSNQAKTPISSLGNRLLRRKPVPQRINHAPTGVVLGAILGFGADNLERTFTVYGQVKGEIQRDIDFTGKRIS